MPVPRTLSIRLADWPARERRFWRDDVLANCEMVTSQRGAVLAERTKLMLLQAFEQWLGFLVRNRLYRPDIAVLDHFSATNAQAFIAEILARKKTVSARIDFYRVASCMRIAYGRDKVLWTYDVLRELRIIDGPRPVRPKPVKTTAELFALGLTMMTTARRRAPPSSRDAVLFRNGLMIALLAARPIRLGNLSAMRIGINLRHEGGLYWLHFSGTETKTGRPIHLPVPRMLTPFLREYLENIRPVLRGANHDHLWASIRGKPLSYLAVYSRVAVTTFEAFGGRISPHKFRHAAATSQAIHDPTRVIDAQKLLGHASFKTTQRYYIHTSTNDGARVLQRNLQQLRGRATLGSKSTSEGS
jgi:integrase/recombinase XerD